MRPRFYVAVSALIRQGDQVLLVEQQARNDPRSHWMLPGGLLESGELLPDALAREVAEETGLQLETIGFLAYQIQAELGYNAAQTLAYTFEVSNWSGQLAPNDPDEEILQVGFYPIEEALNLLESVPWRSMREPAQLYLRGDLPKGALLLYKNDQKEQTQLVAQI
jgi:8-oxo-dGTP diphosphatase